MRIWRALAACEGKPPLERPTSVDLPSLIGEPGLSSSTVSSHLLTMEQRGNVARIALSKTRHQVRLLSHWRAVPGNPPNRGRNPDCPTCGKPRSYRHKHKASADAESETT
ncbi:MAG: hypothetical protein AABY75_08080 [Bacteroidota bacterium]